MAKKTKPNLKGYLKTGKRSTADFAQEPAPAVQEPASSAPSNAFLDLLAPSDLKMWESMLYAGTTLQLLHLDVASLREEFQAMDGGRFTYYTLAKKGEPLRPIRSASQINEPLALLLKWDETGVLTVYDPSI